MIGALIALVSLDVCEKLVAAGIVASTLTLTGATNATPIVVQTSAPHGLLAPGHGVVSGVTGNTAANGTWILTPTDATHLTLTSFSPQGAVVQSVGSGAYASGGLVQFALTDRRFLVGEKYRFINGAPPRVVWAPYRSPAWVLDPYGGVIPPLSALPSTIAQQTAEQITMRTSRQVMTEPTQFRVWIIAALNPPDPDFGDFDLTQSIAHQIVESMFRLLPARYKVLGAHWTSQDPNVQKWDARGQELEMAIEILQPVTAIPLGLFVPGHPRSTITVNLAGGGSGDATIIQVP